MATPAPPEAAPPARSPAGHRTQTLVAVAFVAVWLAAALYDFFANPGEPALPLWFHALGILVLGFLLGINFAEAAGRFHR